METTVGVVLYNFPLHVSCWRLQASPSWRTIETTIQQDPQLQCFVHFIQILQRTHYTDARLNNKTLYLMKQTPPLHHHLQLECSVSCSNLQHCTTTYTKSTMHHVLTFTTAPPPPPRLQCIMDQSSPLHRHQKCSVPWSSLHHCTTTMSAVYNQEPPPSPSPLHRHQECIVSFSSLNQCTTTKTAVNQEKAFTTAPPPWV